MALTDSNLATRLRRTLAWLKTHPAVVWTIIPIVVYLLLVLLRITQSNIGISTMREDPANPSGVQLGTPEAIRTDEYLAWTPNALQIAVTGKADDFNPLTFGPGVFGGSTHGVVSNIVLFDRTLLRLGSILPVENVFAAYWWLPTLLLFLATPILFRFLAGSRPLGLFAAILMFFNPSNSWWSYLLTNALGYGVAGCVCLVGCCQALLRKKYVAGVPLGLLSALLIAHTAFQYQPFTIVTLPGVLVPTVLALWADKKTRVHQILVVVGVGILTLMWAGAVVLENSAELHAMFATVYPGSRRSTGMASTPGAMFGAPALYSLSHQPVMSTNQSELSSGFNILVIIVLVLAIVGLSTERKSLTWAWRGTWVVTIGWLIWCLSYTGNWSSKLLPLNLVPADRARQSVGEVIAVLLCLTLARAPRQGRLSHAIYGALCSCGMVAWAASNLMDTNLPMLHFTGIAVSSLAVGAVAFLLIWRPVHWGGYVLASVLALTTVVSVNPLIVGLGDIRDSESATYFQNQGEEARQNGTLWATDNGWLAALMKASGVPMVNTGMQSAPDDDVWSKLDPHGEYADVWNRGGGTHVFIAWDDSPAITMSNPYPDEILIQGSPCALDEALPELDMVTSQQPLHDSCLAPEGTVEWSGETQYIYSIDETR